ncbi:MAG: insulinase family protein [Chloroflexi bacterium]|nr:insulinase family protein [Chloroflexota bacterium]
MAEKITHTTYPNTQTIRRQVLANGITVLVYERFASPSLVIDGLVRAGALAESRQTAGLAHFTAVSLMRGTENYTFEQIYEALESVGASLNFSGAYHTTGFSAQGLVEDADLFLELLAEALRQPVFPDAEVEKVRGQLLTGIAMRENDPQQMAGLAFDELIYGEHPYGRSDLGYMDSLPDLTVDDLRQFHRRYYGPQGMIMTVVGAMKAEEVVEKVTAVLGDWRNPHQEKLPDAPDAPRPESLKRIHVPMPDKQQSNICLGLPGPRRAAPDYLDASLMNTILGVFGMMGRIGQKVREEKNLAYDAYSVLQGGLGPAPWYAAAGVAPPNVEAAIAAILAEIERIQNELVPAEELADNQAYRIGSLPMSLETNGGLANVISDMELYGLGLDYLLEYPHLIREITPERIRVAAQKYLSAEQLGIAVAGPGGG